MKKTILILSVLVFLASGCGNKKDKTTFDLTTFPAKWRSLITENGELAANDSPFSVIQITGNSKFIQHNLVKVDETGYDENDFEYEIVKTYQKGDTIVFCLKSVEDFAIDYYFVWLDESRGLGEWTSEYKAEAEIYVVNDRVSEYPIQEKKEKQMTKKIKYYFKANGDRDERKIVFFDDGTVCWGCELGEVRQDETTEYYSEHFDRNCLIVGKLEDYPLFDDFGYILPDWEIFNFRKVNSQMQITNFEANIEEIAKSNIQDINKTCLIFITPEETYEEWVMYRYDRQAQYETMNIKAVDAEKQYLSFTLADGEKIVIDTKKEQNGKIAPTALLYKKGQIPIMISISGESDYGNKIIEEYLQ
ncbi:MAG: hypothetical protein FWH23_07790 [Bacteroidales bacterium]|nr:hypothetical protein [Bacteroidales bacterium]MCL2133087.1 hypothetical protein [Bacteroidales bacterium]